MWNLALKILTDYGLPMLIVISILVFCTWMFTKLFNFFMRTNEQKDVQLQEFIKQKDADAKETSEKFSRSVDANTEALNLIRETQTQLVNSVQAFQSWLRDANRRDHELILQGVRQISGR